MSNQSILGETNSFFRRPTTLGRFSPTNRRPPFPPPPRPFPFPNKRPKQPIVIIKSDTFPRYPINYGSPGFYYYYPTTQVNYGLNENKKITVCSANRPEFCTTEYRPVCGIYDNGLKGNFSNGCNACATPGVQYHEQGECEKIYLNLK